MIRGEQVKLEHSEEILINVHSAEQCRGRVCVIHKRSDHHMRHLPQHWRVDRRIMERICKHGIGHPDPDQMLWPDDAVHGCCGECCVSPDAEELTTMRRAQAVSVPRPPAGGGVS